MFKRFIAAALLSFSVISTLPQNSHALMMLVGDSDILNGPGDVILCVVLLPFCILNEEGQVSQVSDQDLRDNGYSNTQIQNIRESQNKVMTYLQGSYGATASNLPSDQVVSAIEKLKPELSSDYLNFVGQK